MKAVAHTFTDLELPKPSPAGHDLLVKVEAVSVNPVDYKQRKAGSPTPRVLGWDAAGTVEAIGKEVTLFKPGDAVYYAGDVTRPGCNSEFHLVDERIVGRKPKKLDFAQAAAIPLTAITAWESYHDRMKVKAGATLPRQIAALQHAGKSFDVQVGPDRGHTGLNQDRMMEFFIENLVLAFRPSGV